MAKRSFNYRRRRYGYRRYKTPSALNYFKAKIEGVYNVSFPAAGGQPVFTDFNPVASSVTFTSIFQQSAYYGFLNAGFGYYKVTGISIEAVPQIKNLGGGTLVGCSILCGFIFGSDVGTTYNTLRTNNDSLLLNVGERTRKYINTLGSNGWHASADSTNVGVFGVASSVDTTLNNGPGFSIRICFYLAFKKSNV